ncbi:MAG: hypothetical protein ABI600_12085 [Luteolibacter sp.]
MRRLLLLFLLATHVSAQETIIREVYDTKTDTHVEVMALFSKPSPGGYLPVRVKVANNLQNDRSIQLTFESATNYSRGNHTSSSFGFTAPAGKTLTQDILVPLSPGTGTSSYGGNVTTRLSGSLGEASNSLADIPDSSKAAVLLSEALFTPNASSLDAAMGTSSYGGRNEFAAKFDPKQLPDSWLAFSGYDSVIMTDTDWANTPASGRNAIVAWLRMGGQLAIFTTGKADAKTLGIPDDASFGSVAFKTISTDLKLDAKETIALVNTLNPTSARSKSISSGFDGNWPLQNHFGTQTFRYGLFIAVLILFAIMVGPVNLFIFAKSGQRHKLFITTPLISLVASLILIGLIIIQDGFGGSGMRRLLMEVRPDGDQNAAYLHQEQFCRTGVLTGSRFTMSDPCFFSPVPISSSRWARYTNSGNTQSSLNLQPNDGKLDASGDWFQSRSEHGHVLSAVVSTRGRIELTDIPHTFLSTFEFPIETLYYCDNDGQWYRAEAITTGKRFSLTPVEFSMVMPVLQQEAGAFADRTKQMLERTMKRKGYYIAFTNQAPGIPTHPGIRWMETRTVITGPVLAP